MPQSNGKQHHLNVTDLIARAIEKRSRPWHWDALDLDLRLRRRSTVEQAALMQEMQTLQRDLAAAESGEGEPVDVLELYRVRLRNSIECALDPDTGVPRFGIDDVEALLALDTPALNELLDEVDTLSNFTKEQADEAAKNFVATAGGSTSSVSPSAAATPASLPIPMR